MGTWSASSSNKYLMYLIWLRGSWRLSIQLHKNNLTNWAGEGLNLYPIGKKSGSGLEEEEESFMLFSNAMKNRTQTRILNSLMIALLTASVFWGRFKTLFSRGCYKFFIFIPGSENIYRTTIQQNRGFPIRTQFPSQFER